MNFKTYKFLLAFSLLALPVASNAANKIEAKVPSGYKMMKIKSSTGESKISTRRSASFDVTSTEKNRLYLLGSDGQIAANVLLGVKKGSKVYSYTAAKAQRICRQTSARAIYGTKGALNLGSLRVKSSDGFAYSTAAINKKKLNLAALGTISSSCVPTGNAATLGYGTSEAQAAKKRLKIKILADSDDSDSDGLINVLDVDDDDDGVMDNFDADTVTTEPPSGTADKAWRVFSNNKPSIQSSVNAYAQTVSDTDLDNFVNRTTLAIQVAGGTTLATELDCGALNYCKSGGTGTSNSSAFPDNFDTDSDGKGTIENGPTGDFQLFTNAAARTDIGAGDILIQEVDNGDGTTSILPGMLSFVFNTSPAIASVTMGSSTVTPTYPAAEGMQGSENNPFVAPSGWDQKATIVVYRPQRPGIPAAGEGTLVDVGNSKISIDIPNLPCSSGTSGGCSGQNTVRCSASSYTETDSNLAIDGEGLLDLRADQDTDTTNPTANQLTFTVDLSTCVPPSTYISGTKLALDVQFSNDVGDNAAQKFYIEIP